jgi:hypothetical protein
VIGTWGHNFYYPLEEAFMNWCKETGGWVDFVTKGHWPFSEHYSAMRADVVDPEVFVCKEIGFDLFLASVVSSVSGNNEHCVLHPFLVWVCRPFLTE